MRLVMFLHQEEHLLEFSASIYDPENIFPISTTESHRNISQHHLFKTQTYQLLKAVTHNLIN